MYDLGFEVIYIHYMHYIFLLKKKHSQYKTSNCCWNATLMFTSTYVSDHYAVPAQ